MSLPEASLGMAIMEMSLVVDAAWERDSTTDR